MSVKASTILILILIISYKKQKKSQKSPHVLAPDSAFLPSPFSATNFTASKQSSSRDAC